MKNQDFIDGFGTLLLQKYLENVHVHILKKALKYLYSCLPNYSNYSDYNKKKKKSNHI